VPIARLAAAQAALEKGDGKAPATTA
jgi:hypothetical protein